MCNMRRLNSHRELGKFLHAAAAACCCRATLFALKQLHWMYGAYCATVKGGGIAAWGWRRRHKLEQRSKVTSLLANRFYFLTSFFSVCKYSVRLGQNPCRWKDDECCQFVSGLQNHLPISLNLSILTYYRFCPCRTCMCIWSIQRVMTFPQVCTHSNTHKLLRLNWPKTLKICLDTTNVL